ARVDEVDPGDEAGGSDEERLAPLDAETAGDEEDDGGEGGRLDEPAHPEADGGAAEERLHRGGAPDGARRGDERGVEGGGDGGRGGDGGAADGAAVEEPEEVSGEDRAALPGEDVDVDAEDMNEVCHALEENVGGEERQDREAREEPADLRAEEQRRELLQETEVDLAAVVDAGQTIGEQAIGAEQRIAGKKLAGAAEVLELELVLGDRVAETPEAEVAALDDAVEELGDELFARDLLGQVGGAQADLVEDALELGAERGTGAVGGAVGGLAEEDGELVVVRQLAGGVVEAAREADVATGDERADERPAPEAAGPTGQIDAERLADAVDGRLLEVVEEPERRCAADALGGGGAG